MLKSTQAVAALAALAQANRLAIFRLLVGIGEPGMAAGRIAEKLGLSPATVSFHVKTLNHAHLINSRQEGRFIYYSANFAMMNRLLAYLTDHCCAGGSCELVVNKC